MPSNSVLCPRNIPNRRPKDIKSAFGHSRPQTKERAVSWATWLKTRVRGILNPSTLSYVLWFLPLKIAPEDG